MRVGFLSLAFQRGQAIVTKTLAQAIDSYCEIMIMGQPGFAGGQWHYDPSVFEDRWPITHHNKSYYVEPREFAAWINQNDIDCVILNEQYPDQLNPEVKEPWLLLHAIKETGAKLYTYLDYYKDADVWREGIALYDMVLCSSYRTYDLVKDLCKAHYIGWGVDTELYKPNLEGPKFTFFHNAGFLGINYRKGTPVVVEAFNALRAGWATLLIHAQVPVTQLPRETQQIISDNSRITYHEETVPAPGLYHFGQISLAPTKMEGLGLVTFESLSCGLPVITTDAAPMNEVVSDDRGALVPVEETEIRADNIAFPEHKVRMDNLLLDMTYLASRPIEISKKAEAARAYAEEQLSLSKLGDRIMEVL